MRRIRYAVATSLDGYLAGPRGEIDWITMDSDINFVGISQQFDTVEFLYTRVKESANPKERLVFVSHSSVDTWIAKQVAREIEDRGAIPFLDEAQVDAGADFEEDILIFWNEHTN